MSNPFLNYGHKFAAAREQARYDKALDTYARKKYGDDYDLTNELREEFEQWLESKNGW